MNWLSWLFIHKDGGVLIGVMVLLFLGLSWIPIAQGFQAVIQKKSVKPFWSILPVALMFACLPIAGLLRFGNTSLAGTPEYMAS